MTMKKTKLLAMIMTAALLLSGCDNGKTQSSDSNSSVTASSDVTPKEDYNGKLVFDHSMELKYAEHFSVDYYKGGYKLITIKDNAKLLIVPENMSVPESVESMERGTVIMQQPISNLLMNCTAMAAMLDYLGRLDAVSFSTDDSHSWYIEGVKTAVDEGRIKYVGQYDSPDYEQLAAAGVKYGVFSSMVMDNVKVQLESIGLTPILDISSKETHPLAKVEWAKLYGAMFNCEEKAEQLLAEQEKAAESLPKTDKTVAVFYITSSGKLYARKAGDYMTKMVELGGGNYIFPELGVGETGTKNMEHEAFFDGAKNADYIIYVWSMGGKPETLADLLSRSEILSELKAVKDGNVWCTTPDFFQAQNNTGNMIADISKMLNSDGSAEEFDYLVKLK